MPTLVGSLCLISSVKQKTISSLFCFLIFERGATSSLNDFVNFLLLAVVIHLILMTSYTLDVFSVFTVVVDDANNSDIWRLIFSKTLILQSDLSAVEKNSNPHAFINVIAIWLSNEHF